MDQMDPMMRMNVRDSQTFGASFSNGTNSFWPLFLAWSLQKVLFSTIVAGQPKENIEKTPKKA
jgi:hypothetical protein